jgi:hypothetical protein
MPILCEVNSQIAASQGKIKHTCRNSQAKEQNYLSGVMPEFA